MSHIPSAARIEQFDFERNSAWLTCKNCGVGLEWDTSTGRSELLEMFAAIEVHQCDPTRRLRKEAHELADKITHGSGALDRYEVGEKVRALVRSFEPEPFEDDD